MTDIALGVCLAAQYLVRHGEEELQMCLPFPGQSICFFTTARACATNTSNHMAICTTVAALATHKMASLSRAVPISIMAMMKPVLGKTNDHQVCEGEFSLYADNSNAFQLTRWKLIFLIPLSVASNDMQKKNSERDQRTMARNTATIFRT